jgi:hypothetical protein
VYEIGAKEIGIIDKLGITTQWRDFWRDLKYLYK